ncbi:MAG: S-adenosylmethionine:tRNA ribosyltransferase-isomerase [Pseudonocardia sp.]|nr:S-adenosylmethionine:tRNA ribosyltransferase-isomerase [Pseudonocardia sp.]
MARTRFTVPAGLSADAPPEARGLARDEVRLLVARDRRRLRHARFTDLPGALEPGDLVVVNTSDTEPAAVDGRRSDGRPVALHVSGPTPDVDGGFVVELRTPAGERVSDAAAGESVHLPCGVVAVLQVGYPDPGAHVSRLWRATMPVEGGVPAYLAVAGRPIRYYYLAGDPTIEDYRTVLAGRSPSPRAEFAGAEMPSAARPFSRRVLAGLAARGVDVAEIVLHAGVSSPEADEVPLPERYRVPGATAEAVNAARARGGRIVAVGTTVTRALETVADTDGMVRAGSGWTDLVLGPDRPVRVVDGLVTGWHEPEASHLLLLEAVAGPHLVGRAYRAALEREYLWHEFGDSCLLLPDRHG